MKQADFDRLKAVCEKEGFELLNESASDNDKFFVVKKAKDIWEGVEFAYLQHGEDCFDARSYFKVDKIDETTIYSSNGSCFFKSSLVPSTESAYIEQLKAEAFKRFGEIKEGETFVDAYSSQKIKTTNGFIKMYNKHIDCFAIGGVVFYSKSKWATRVKERVKVEFFNDAFDEHEGIEQWGFYFKIQNHNYGSKLSKESGSFLASKLEEYLNKE